MRCLRNDIAMVVRADARMVKLSHIVSVFNFVQCNCPFDSSMISAVARQISPRAHHYRIAVLILIVNRNAPANAKNRAVDSAQPGIDT